MATTLFSYDRNHWLAPDMSSTTKIAAVIMVAALSCRLGLIVYRLYFHPLRMIPGPKFWIASDLPFNYNMNISGHGIRHITEFHRKHGPVVRVGPNRLSLDGNIGWPQVFARRSALEPEYQKAPGYFSPGSEHGIIGSPTQVHRRQRKQLAHGFSDAVMHEHEQTINHYVELLVQRLQEHADSQKSVNIVQWLNFTSFDIIGHMGYGESFGSLESSNYHPWVLSIFQGLQADTFARACRAYPIMGTLVSWLFHGKISKGMENRKLGMEKGKSRMALGIQPKGQKDFMSYMMQADREGRPVMSPIEIITNSPVLVVAGSETTASALSAFFFYISQTPKAKQTLLNEIRTAFADETEITLTTTTHLEYLHAVIEETLRVYPPAPNTPARVCPGGVIDGKPIPKGTEVMVMIWSTFRNPEHFADPDSFRPERWLKETHEFYDTKFANDNHGVFKPFSFGPRDCIGKNLAYSEMRMIISHLLYRFDFDLLPGQDDWHSKQVVQFIWNKGPLYIQFKGRDDKSKRP